MSSKNTKTFIGRSALGCFRTMMVQHNGHCEGGLVHPKTQWLPFSRDPTLGLQQEPNLTVPLFVDTEQINNSIRDAMNSRSVTVYCDILHTCWAVVQKQWKIMAKWSCCIVATVLLVWRTRSVWLIFRYFSELLTAAGWCSGLTAVVTEADRHRPPTEPL